MEMTQCSSTYLSVSGSRPGIVRERYVVVEVEKSEKYPN